MIKLFITLSLLTTYVWAGIYSNDPDIDYDVQGFAKSRGFIAIPYKVLTKDNYILTIFRIVNPFIKQENLKPRPVLLWHGNLSSAISWISNRHGVIKNGNYSEDDYNVFNDCMQNITSTLGFTLSACGYDVWLANTRGNSYSDGHKYLTIKDSKYWEFTLTEIALYDIPATIEQVLQVTGKKCLSYIGHSMGTTIAFILLSLRPEYEQYMRPYIALAPSAYANHTTSIIRMFAPIEPTMRSVAIGIELPFIRYLGKYVCGNSVFVHLCSIYLGLIFGFDANNTDFSRIPQLVSHLDRTSSKVVSHVTQFFNSGRFAQFDHGLKINEKVYNQSEPPSYPLKDIESNEHTYLYLGLNDPLANPIDVKRLHKELSGSTLITNHWSSWNHLDFIAAKFENIYQDISILKILKNYDYC